MNQLYFGDCLDILKKFYDAHPAGFVDLIYIDPPFNSKRTYNILFETVDLKDAKAQKEAFADTWSNISYKDTLDRIKDIDLDLWSFLENLDRIRISKSAVSYLTTMAIRIYYMHKVLNDTGSFYLHCDPTMSHYLKIMCDLIFGTSNLRNEIIWHYQRWPAKQKNFQRMHDVILFYSKKPKSNTFNVFYEPLSPGTMKRWRGKKSLVEFDGDVRLTTQMTNSDSPGRPEDDVWNIAVINSQAQERLGYPTQKPEALLEKIIRASSNKDDLILDPFCGCGTSISVAEHLERRWIGIDISHLAIGLIERRLIAEYGKQIVKTYDVDGMPKDIGSARRLAEGTIGGRLKFEEWIIETKLGGIHKPHQGEYGSWDGHLTFEVPGGRNTKEVLLIEVKSGKTGIRDIRNFVDSVRGQKAAIGVFVAFADEISLPMQAYARDQGFYNEDVFKKNYRKIQILTVEDLLDGDMVSMPDTKRTTFKEAKRKDRWQILHERSKLF